MKKYQLSVEVIEVVDSIYDGLDLQVVSKKKSVNGFFDLVIEGSKDSLLKFLKEHHGEDELYFYDYNVEVRICDKYSIDCSYYKNSFNTLEELVEAVKNGGIDPNYEVTKNGVGIGEQVVDFLTY